MRVPKILIVAATSFEIAPLLAEFNIVLTSATGLFKGGQNVSVLITGVGMVNTAYYVGRYSETGFDLIINAGVCGAFNRSILIGEVVEIVADTLAELGAEDGENFIKFEEMDLPGTATYCSKHDYNKYFPSPIKKIKAITVNKVHGNVLSITKTKTIYQADIESMEGAAFFRACEMFTGSYLQLRSVSNFVEKRDKSRWNMPLAIQNLNDFIIHFIRNSSHES